VFGTASSPEKLERLRALGLDHGIDSRGDFVAAVRERSGGRGVDLVIDSIGGRTLARSLEALAYRGRATFVGSTAREPDSVDASALRPRNLTLTGVFFGAELAIHHARVHAMVARHIADAATGALRIEVDRRFPLAEAGAAHAYLESRKAFGRVVLIP
jgi:NADPH2:quinone reductase